MCATIGYRIAATILARAAIFLAGAASFSTAARTFSTGVIPILACVVIMAAPATSFFACAVNPSARAVLLSACLFTISARTDRTVACGAGLSTRPVRAVVLKSVEQWMAEVQAGQGNPGVRRFQQQMGPQPRKETLRTNPCQPQPDRPWGSPRRTSWSESGDGRGKRQPTDTESAGNKNKSNMQIVKAGLKSAKPADLVGKSEYIEAGMTGNANFPTPSPKVTDLTDARTALVAAIAEAQGGAHAAIATKNAAARTLAQLLTKMARYVNSVAAGDVEKAVSSGFELAKRPDPIDHLDAPTQFEGRTAAIAGQVDLRWKGVHGARMYFVYIEENGVWKSIGMVSKARFTAAGLITDKQYSFRVAAVGRIGEGPVSQEVTAKAA